MAKKTWMIGPRIEGSSNSKGAQSWSPDSMGATTRKMINPRLGLKHTIRGMYKEIKTKCDQNYTRISFQIRVYDIQS